MSEFKPFKKVLISSTALIGSGILASTSALAASCPTTITNTALANIACDFNTGNSVTVESGAEAGQIYMNSYNPTNSFILNSGTISNNNTGGIVLVTSSLTNGLTNNGIINTDLSAIDINNSTINGGISNTGISSTANGEGLGIRTSTINGGIANSGNLTGGGNNSGVTILASTVNGSFNNSGSLISGNAGGNALLVTNNSTLSGNVINSGSITGDGDGIALRNISNITGAITNSGTITGTTGNGIRFSSASALGGSISNSGTISGAIVGIDISATNITGGIQNLGAITGGTSGIRIASTSSVTGAITNGGTITGGNYGIVVEDSSANAIINNGTINLTNNAGRAMHNANSNNNIITNNGTINFIIGSYGISSIGNNNTLTNNGFMEVRHGISANGTTNILTNNGTISSHGLLGGGLAEATAGNSQLINNGTITGTGDTSYGLKGVGGNSLTNNGYIRTTGPGIQGVGDSMTIVNRGTIGNFDAIAVTGNNNTTTLGMNSVIRGNITFTGTGNTLVYDVANVPRTGGVIYVGNTITGADTVTIANTSSLPADAKIAQDGNSIAVITPEQFAGTQQIVSQTLNDAGTVLGNRQQLALLGDTTEAAGGAQYAASTVSLSDAANSNGWAVRDRKVAWAEGFGSYQERGDNGDMLDSKARAGGIMAGIDLPQTDSGYRSGVYVGGFTGTVDIGSSFRTLDSDGALVGGYIGKSFGGTYISGQLGFGISNNETDRYTGVDTANADYNSYFVSPTFTVMHPVRTSGITWVPSATMRYTAQFDESYTESGSVVNQSLDSHTSNSLDGRIMLEAKFDPSQWKYGMLKTSLRAGVQGQTLLGSSKVNVQTLGTNLSFDPKGGDNYVDGILGASLVHSVDERLDLYGDAEANLGFNKGGAGSNKGAVGRLGARWKL